MKVFIVLIENLELYIQLNMEIICFRPLGSKYHDKICDNYLDYFVTHFDSQYDYEVINVPEYINPKRNYKNT